MRKVIVTCECGQRLQAPFSALGRTGVCVACGRKMQIALGAVRTEPAAEPHDAGPPKRSWWRKDAAPSPDAQERFARAVDLYCSGNYAEALALLDVLSREYPDRPEVEQARAYCFRALHRPRLGVAEGLRTSPGTGALDEDTIKRVLLDKLLHGRPDSVQIDAARLACELLGLLPGKAPGNFPSPSGNNGHRLAGETETGHPLPETDREFMTANDARESEGSETED